MLTDTTRLVEEDEDLDARTVIAAQGHRRWKVERIFSPHPCRAGYPRGDAVYILNPLGGDTFGFGGVKRLVRSQHDLITNGWRVYA